MRQDSRQAIAAYRSGGGLVVFLDVSLAFAAERVGLDDSRPMIAGDTRGRWMTLMAERRPVFDAVSDFRILTDGGTPQDAAMEIVRRLRLAGAMAG
jgi:shikimate kinase